MSVVWTDTTMVSHASVSSCLQIAMWAIYHSVDNVTLKQMITSCIENLGQNMFMFVKCVCLGDDKIKKIKVARSSLFYANVKVHLWTMGAKYEVYIISSMLKFLNRQTDRETNRQGKLDTQICHLAVFRQQWYSQNTFKRVQTSEMSICYQYW